MREWNASWQGRLCTAQVIAFRIQRVVESLQADFSCVDYWRRDCQRDLQNLIESLRAE